MEKKKLQSILSKPFVPSDWQNLLTDVFGVKNFLQKPIEIPLPNNKKAESAFELGSFNTADDRIIGLYLVKVKPEVWLERNKVGLRQLLRSIYQYDVDGALIVFEQSAKWRLSFVSEIRTFDEEGNIAKKVTEPKRYTYLLGDGEKTRTPVDRLWSLAGKKLYLEEIRNAFSVEALNEEFYQIVARHFYQLVGAKEGKGTKEIIHNRVLQLPIGEPTDSPSKKVYQEFSVRLIGRTVFCWFLKVKKSDENKSLLPEHLLSSEAVQNYPNYYHSILENLFFQTLNTPMVERWKNLPDGCEQIPFLNGGLFEPETEDYYKVNKTTRISEYLNTLRIPDKWFKDFFEKLEQYNFTIDENSVVDIEVSVDPEMLGRIFENLLAEIDPDSGETARKATGSFYTPREIVDYMATESLVHFLHNKTRLDQDALQTLFKIDQPIDSSLGPYSLSLLQALDSIKILDPACGSGAFPIGVLQKIVMALQKLDKDAIWWTECQVEKNTDPTARKAVKEKLVNNAQYARKIGVIQNSLYGVDIQPIAAEISKLRCFLTLIVDERIIETEPNRGIEPLPNLEFKFVTADTLRKLPADSGDLFNSFDDDLAQLKRIRLDYLQSTGDDKLILKEEFKAIQDNVVKKQAKTNALDPNSRAFLISTWNPFSHEKVDWFDPQWMFGVKQFDVVIGNPPYVQMQKDKGYLAEKYKTFSYETYERTGDVYSLFYEKGLSLLSKEGNLNFITSDKWMRAEYGKSLRNYLSKKLPIKLLLLGEKVFKSATVNTNILLAESRSKTEPLMALELSKGQDILNLSKSEFSTLDNLGEDPWIVLNAQELHIKKLIDRKGLKIKDDKTLSINRGLITGLNEAFIIDTKTKDRLSSKESEKIFRKVLIGKNVKKYQATWDGLWLINSHNGDKKKPRVEINDYPQIKNYLDSFEPKLSSRYDKGDTVYNLRNCAYLDDFEKQKIVWGNLATNVQFAIAEEGMYVNAPSPFITPANKALLGILNSKLADFYIRKLGVVRAGGFFEYKPMFVEQFPIASLSLQQSKILETIVNYRLFLSNTSIDQINDHVPNSHIIQLFEEVIDAMVFELYFEEDFKKADISIIKYVERDFQSIEGKSEDESIRIIHSSYQKLRETDNEVRNNIQLMKIELRDLIMPIISA